MAVSVAQVAFGGPACKGLFVSSMQNFKSIVRKGSANLPYSDSSAYLIRTQISACLGFVCPPQIVFESNSIHQPQFSLKKCNPFPPLQCI